MREQLGTSGLKEGAVGAVESKHPEKPSRVEEGETMQRCRKHSPRKRINGGTLVDYRPVSKRWLCKKRPLLRDARKKDRWDYSTRF
jgi:hypothetical protein